MKLFQRATNWTVFLALLIEALAWGSLERFLPGVFVLVLVGPVLQGRVRLPRLVSATLAVAAVLFAVLRSRAGLEVEVILADFSLHLLVLKCFDRRNPRDETQLLSLSALMVFAAALRDEPPLLMWLAMLIWARLAFSAVILRQTGEDQGTSDAQRLARRARYRVGNRLFLVSLIGGGLLFLVLPRSIGRFRIPTPKTEAIDRAVDDGIDLSVAGGRIVPDPSVIGTVEVSPATTSVAQGSLYLRCGVLTTASDGIWYPPRSSLRMVDGEGDVGMIGPESGDRLSLRFKMDEPQWRLGAPGAPVRLECEVPTLIRMTGRVAVVEPEFPGTTSWSVVTRLDPSAPEVLSYLGSSPRPQRRGDWWNPQSVTRASMAERARTVLRDANFDPATLSDGFGPKVEAAKILERHFSSSGQYVYDLDLSLLRIRENEDPIEAFLRVKRGHCEFFATSLVAMCQSLGIEARVVLGWLVGNEPANGSRVIRRLDAHAWAEVRQGPNEWVRLEPTPASDLLAFRATGADRGIAGLLADLGEDLNRNLNGYGTGNKFPIQVALEDFLGVDFSDDVSVVLSGIGSRLRWPILGLLLGGVVWGALGVKKRRRRGGPLYPLLLRLRRRGLIRPAGQPLALWIEQLQWPEQEAKLLVLSAIESEEQKTYGASTDEASTVEVRRANGLSSRQLPQGKRH